MDERSLYTVYLPKVKGESLLDRKINILFKEFSQGLSCICNGKYTVISSPGYLSRSDKEIENFFTHLSDILLGTSISLGFLKGMNKANDKNNNKMMVNSSYRAQRDVKYPAGIFRRLRQLDVYKVRICK